MNVFTKIFIPLALSVCILGFAGLGFSCGDVTNTDSGTAISQPVSETTPVPTSTEVAEIDSDRDGLPDSREVELGTDLFLVDTDSDGYSDQQEVETGHDPLAR